MFSTTAIIKSSKLSGRVVGTHQRLDQAARHSLAAVLPRRYYFPSSQRIAYFSGSRGPDGLKHKSPGLDEPTHLLVMDGDQIQSETVASSSTCSNSTTDQASDPRTVIEQIIDHHYNLVQALRTQNQTRAAFEAAWLSHMIVDGLTPAHHFPLSEVKDELMTNKEMVKIFGEPIKGVMHGQNPLETMRNNWLYWGAGGYMSKHFAYEYGALMLSIPLTPRNLAVNLTTADLAELDIEQMFRRALARVCSYKMYDRFLEESWTTNLAQETRNILFPEMVRAIALGWYSAAHEAYHLGGKNE